MTPGPWTFVLLALAAFRITRLLGWDDFPPVARVRARLLGEYWIPGEERGRPSEVAYRRPTLAHLVHCPFCLGAWVSIATYLAWWALPTIALPLAAIAALSATVGLVAKKLDP